MCEPTTLAWLIPTVVGAIQTIAQYKSGQASQESGKIQGAIYDRQAAETADAGQQAAEKIRKQGEAGRGAAVAGIAASGIKVGEGSALETERKIIQNSEEDALMSILNAKRQANTLHYQAELARYNGKQGVYASQAAMAGTVLQAAGQYNLWRGQSTAGAGGTGA